MAREAKPFLHRGWYKTDLAGVRRKLCREEEGLEKAKVELARLIVQLNDGTPTEVVEARPADVTKVPLGFVFDRFLEMKRIEKGKETYKYYADKLTPLYDFFGNLPITSLTRHDGLRYKEFLMKEKPWEKGKEKMRGLGRTTVNHHLKVAKSLLNFACDSPDEYGLKVNPWNKLEKLADKQRERTLTDEEFRHLVKNCKAGDRKGYDEDFREMLCLMRATGVRPGELRCLRWEYIRWEEHQIIFPKEVIKTRNRRAVTLIEWAEKILTRRRARLQERGFLPTGYVFFDPKRPGEKIETHPLCRRFRRLVRRCVKAGLIEAEKNGEQLVPYSHRHTRITEMSYSLAPGVLQAEAGHTDSRTTERYKHPADQIRVDLTRKAAGHCSVEDVLEIH
jgi:integrase